MISYVNISERSLAGGIDAHSAENTIKEGYVEDARNANFTENGYVEKRKGYITYAGGIPLRVIKAEYDHTLNRLCFTFDDAAAGETSIDFSNITVTPLLVYGHLSLSSLTTTTLDFIYSTDHVKYYPTFTADPRVIFPANATTTKTLLGTEHGANSTNLFVGIAQSTSTLNNNNSMLIPNFVKIHPATYNVDVNMTNGTSSDISTFIYVKKKEAVAGSVYLHTITSATTVNIPASTHGLSNFNILVRCYDNNSPKEEVIPDSVVIQPDGQVNLTFSTAFTGTAILSAAAPSNSVTGTIAANSTASITITNLTEDFIFADPYLEVTLGGNLERVIPDSVVVDTVAKQAVVTFQNSTPNTLTFFIYYETTKITTNKLCVTPYTSYSASWTDDQPQLTVWGLDHEKLYPQKDNRAGWVTHIDRYESEGERKIVCALGWNFFQEIDQTAQYMMPTWYGRIRGRVSTGKVIGPAFYDSTDTPTRTRGYIKFDGGGEGWAVGTEVTWDSGTGWVKYKLSCPNMVVSGTLSTIIQSGALAADALTVEQAPFAVHNGTFKIRQVNLLTNGLEIYVENPEVTSSDYNATDCGMACGIFTDTLSLQSGTNTFIPGDRLLSAAFSDDTVYTVFQSETATTIRISGVYTEFTLLAGLSITGERPSSRVISLRQLDGLRTFANTLQIVQGDMVALEGYKREMRVQAVYPIPDETVSITGDGVEATITLTSTKRYIPGSYILLLVGPYAGIHKITEIVSTTQMRFESSLSITATAVLVGYTIVLDEDVPNYRDPQNSSNAITVAKRWVPIEAPVDSWGLTPVTYPKYLKQKGYTNQPFVRSVMVNDNLYFTNGVDPVFKFDSTNIYRAGLPRWQPGQFITVANEGTGNIDVAQITTSNTASNTANTAIIKVTSGEENRFRLGDLIKYVGNYYLIEKISADGSNGILSVNSTITTANTGQTVAKVYTYRYYFRLNAIDANDNLIASAITGHDNFRVYVSQNCDIRIKLIGLPAWDIYDYNRLEVEVYRTKANGTVFYRVKNIRMEFERHNGYIILQDFESDDTLGIDANVDAISSAIRGKELITSVRPPVRAKYITSAGNRLVLANIKDDPKVDVTFLQKSTVPLTRTSFDGNIFTLRKDNTNTSNITNMIDVIRYHMRNSGDVSASVTASGSGQFTVNVGTHSLDVGHWVYLFRKNTPATNQQLNFAGWWQVVSKTGTTVTFDWEDAPASFTAADEIDRALWATDPRDVPVWLGQDYNYGTVTGNTTTARNATLRWANAVNATQRQVNTAITAFASFTPWIIASAGDDFGAEPRIIFEQPKVESTVFEVELPSSLPNYEVYGNDIRRNPGSSIGAITELKPSRVLVSPPAYPEIFDAPFRTDDTQSLSAIDINAADGQEITGIIPFFGDSAFGAAQKSGVLVVFKTNSIYLVDITAKFNGLNPVQKIESQGLGCTIPFSITPTREGIMFANESGIYKLTRQLTIAYVGQLLERKWNKFVNRDALGLIQGHHFGAERQYKLSVPVNDEFANSHVFVYNHTTEQTRGIGSWSIYDNHPATGWVNLGSSALFGSTKGRVFKLRDNNELSDYRDDAGPVNFEIKFRAMDFGESAIRKRCLHILVHFKNSTVDMTGTKFYTSINLKEDFTQLDDFKVNTPYPLNNLSDVSYRKISSIRFSLSRDKFLYLQAKVTNATIDEPVQITSLDYRVTGLSSKGTEEAADTMRGN